jgi:type 1 glutamine amidotransferase
MVAEEKSLDRRSVLGLAAGGVLAAGWADVSRSRRILILVGPSQHPPGTHEVAAGGRLLKHCIDALKWPDIICEIVHDWPAKFDGRDVATLVCMGDLFPPALMGETVMNDVTRLMKQGAGLVCVHYATGLGPKQVPADGQHPLLDWMGGYFATKCPHHQSVARLFPEATIQPGPKEHPVRRGWKQFTLNDEPYINNYFGPKGITDQVAVLATAQLPPEAPKTETVAWAIERADGGRGAGVVMPHFYRNWKLPDLRMLILNAIGWSAKIDVPAEGFRVPEPDLAAFEPAAVEPPPKKKK